MGGFGNYMTAPFFSIVVLNYNRLKYSKQTIECLLNRTTLPAEYILVDNGSNKELKDFLLSVKTKTKSTVKCSFSEFNRGVSGGRNRGILISNPNSKIIVCIDDDILVPEKWDHAVAEIYNNINNVGIIGICVESKEYPISTINGVRVRTKSGNINGGCMMMPRSVFNRVGYFQTNYMEYGRDDTDLDFRTKRMGYKNFYIADYGIHLDENENSEYVKIKKETHQLGSRQDLMFNKNVEKYETSRNYHVPYNIPERRRSRFDIIGGNNERSDEQSKKVAILTITNNCVKHIQNSFNSVINQSVKNFIHIVADIESSDGTRDICEKYKNKNDFVNLFITKEEYFSKIYNHIIYDYIPKNFPCIDIIIILNQGDILDFNAVSEVNLAFKNNSKNEIGAFYSDFSIIDKNRKIVDKKFSKAILVKDQLSKNGQNKIKKLFIEDPPCRFIKAFCLEHVYAVGGFKQKYKYASDFHLFGRMMARYKISKIDKILYYFNKDSALDKDYEKSAEIKKVKKEFIGWSRIKAGD